MNCLAFFCALLYSFDIAFKTLFLSALQSGAIKSFFAPSPEMYALSDFLIMVFVMVSEAVT